MFRCNKGLAEQLLVRGWFVSDGSLGQKVVPKLLVAEEVVGWRPQPGGRPRPLRRLRRGPQRIGIARVCQQINSIALISRKYHVGYSFIPYRARVREFYMNAVI